MSIFKDTILFTLTVVLATEFIIGGVSRVSSWPFPQVHQGIIKKSEKTAPVLYPLIPFRGPQEHMKYVGAWMIVTGILLFVPLTRGLDLTLGLVLFWTGAGAYSQFRVGLPYWLPLVNAGLGILTWLTANGGA